MLAEQPASSSHYGADLARVHHLHFGHVARAAAGELLQRLAAVGLRSGRVVDLATGSGILARHVVDAGYACTGVDLSAAMLALARETAPAADLVAGSVWDCELPSCVAVAAVGEAFSYSADPRTSLTSFEQRLITIRQALVPGGVLLFDVSGPGRSGPDGHRVVQWEGDRMQLTSVELEDSASLSLTRDINLFVPEAGLYRRVQEMHTLKLYRPVDVDRLLTRLDFVWQRLDRYADFSLLPGWHAYVAQRPA